MDKGQLEKSRDFWRKASEFDKKQLKQSLSIAGTGLAMFGGGVVLLLTGEIPWGIVGVGGGGALGYGYGREASAEFQSMVEAQAIEAERQHQLDDSSR